MRTISQKTAKLIWDAHREIAAANKLKQELADHEKWNGGREEFQPLDAMGRPRHFELGVHMEARAEHRLYRVPPSLLPYVLEVHIAAQEKALAEACVIAQMELDGIAAAEPAEEPMKAAAE